MGAVVAVEEDVPVRFLDELQAHRRDLILGAAAFAASRRLRRYLPILTLHRLWTR
jgi:hypothetical protein